MFKSRLAEEFGRTEQETNAQARGTRFEMIIQRLFEERRFLVKRNPQAAAPRQTDLIASRGNQLYLIEVKWYGLRHPANVNDVSALFDRLTRVPPGVVGVLFSMSGYTKSAIKDAECRRNQRPILLVGPEEIRSLVQGSGNLVSLLQRKKHSLTVDGRVFFSTGQGLFAGEPRPGLNLLPDTEYLVWRSDSGPSPWIESKGELNGPVFTCNALDFVAGPYFGHGTHLFLPLGIQNERDLPYVFDILRKAGWVTSSGWWTIRQIGAEWHGSGAANLLTALEQRAARYRSFPTKLHHSEQVFYADVCEGRFYTLHVYVYVGKGETGQIREASISARLPGIPADPSPLHELIHAFDLDDLAYFQPLADDDLPLNVVRFDRGRYRLEPLAYLCLPNLRWVTGIIARNPFGDEVNGIQSQEDLAQIRQILQDSEILVCHLSSWHTLKDEVDYYFLSTIDIAITANSAIVEAGANWNDWINGTHPLNEDEQAPRFSKDAIDADSELTDSSLTESPFFRHL